MLPTAFTRRSFGGLGNTEALGIEHVGAPLSIWAIAASLALPGSYQPLMKAMVNFACGLTEVAPALKACISRFTSGIGIAADQADDIRLGRPPRHHAGEKGRLMDEIRRTPRSWAWSGPSEEPIR